MAIQGIISGFANADNTQENAILIGRGSGYILVVNGRQQGEQTPTLDAGFAALAKACELKPRSWRKVRETSTDPTGLTRVTELSPATMADFRL